MVSPDFGGIDQVIGNRFGVYARGRLWGPTELPFNAGRPVADHVVKADVDVATQAKSLALEVAIPRGSYGLLGGTYEQSPHELLKMSVLGREQGEFSNPLAPATGTFRLGRST